MKTNDKPPPRHDFFHLMAQVKESIRGDYDRVRRRSRDDPGTAGDEVEEGWASILREWLPATYPVVTKGRILFEDGTTSPQIDVLVLAPSYPVGLRRQKHFFAGGVVAAFECKLTLRARDVRKAFKTASLIKKKNAGSGSPFEELNSEPIVGLLAHSLSSKRPRKSWALYDLIEKNQNLDAEHPRELIDLICVADSATVPVGKHILVSPHLTSDEREELREMNLRSGIATMYVIHDEDPLPQVDHTGAVLAGLVFELTTRLAYRDAALRPWADHLAALGFYGGIGRPSYWVTKETLSPRVLREFATTPLKTDRWSYWQKFVP